MIISIMDAEGRITDPVVNELGKRIGDDVRKLFDEKTNWSMADLTVAAYHLQGYISAEIMRRIMGGIIKKQQQLQPPSAILKKEI